MFALLEYSDLSATQTATFANDFYWSRQVDMKTRHGLLRLLRTIAKDDPHLCSTLVGDSLEAPTVVTRRNEPYEVDFVKAAQTFVRGVT